MRNSYMKFQNPSTVLDKRMHAQMDACMHGQPETNMPCQVGGIKIII